MREPRTTLESELARLPEPEPPAGLAEGVMARVAPVDRERREVAREATRAATGEERRGAVPAGGEEPFGGGGLAAALGAVGLAGYVYGLVRGAWTFDPPASPIGDGLTALAAVSQSIPAALGLTMVLLLYLVGLLAPLGLRDPEFRVVRRTRRS